jgi:AcrR family transcriptional regulator
MSVKPKRRYDRSKRDQAARDTRARILAAAKGLYSTRGIESVRLPEIAAKAEVAVSTIFAIFKSRDGILRALIETALFGPAYQAAIARLSGVVDPVALIALTPPVARSIYESEAQDLGLMRNIATFSPALRAMEQEFEALRFAAQRQRIADLFASGRGKAGLTETEARRILWMYTSRDIYRMLVTDGGWTPDAYERWLQDTLLTALLADPDRP